MGEACFTDWKYKGRKYSAAIKSFVSLLVSESVEVEENTYETVTESHYENCNVRGMAEYTQRHQRIASDFLLAQDEKTSHHDAEDDQTDDFW